MHVREMKKWGLKQHHIKIQYLQFLVNLTVHPDVQSVIAKVWTKETLSTHILFNSKITLPDFK
jgi:pentose-5-phosphate-3-epimerase